MDREERKSGLKRKLKAAEMRFDTDDDEPLGSLLKFKKPRNPKKAKVGKSEAKKEKVVDEDEGGMDNTLASFRKKLRAPKKGNRSGVVKGRVTGLDVVESLDQSSSAAIEDVSVDGKEVSNTQGSDCETGGDDVSAMRVNTEVKKKKRTNTKRGKSKSGKTSQAVCNDDAECLAIQEASVDGWIVPRSKEEKISSNLRDENVEDSLSAYLQKAQSGHTDKSCSSSGLMQKNGLNHRSEDVSESVKSVTLRRPRSNATSISALGNKISKENLNSSSASPTLDSTTNEGQIDGMEWSVTGREECQDAMEKFSSAPADLDKSSEKDSLVERDTAFAPSVECQEDKVVGSCGPIVQNVISEDDSTHCPNFTCEGPISKDELKNDKIDISKGVGGAFFQASSIKQETVVTSHGDELLNNSHKVSVGSAEDAKISQLHTSGISLDTIKAEDSSNDCNNPDDHAKAPVSFSASFKKENTEIVNNGSDPDSNNLSNGAHESGNCYLSNQLSLGQSTHDVVASIQKCTLGSSRSQTLDDASKGTSTPNLDNLSFDEDASRASTCATLDENENLTEDAASLPDCEGKDNKVSTIEHGTRKTKNRRHADMAYEGDADWAILINDHEFLDGEQAVVSDGSLRTRERLASSSKTVANAVDDGIIAVSAGLKARAVGPVEKIKFKEVLKRKGGLEEYLECRNFILRLWNKDITRLLHLADCGVMDTPTNREPSRAPLIREVYTFLDQSGYINFGIASRKENTEPVAKHSYKVIKETSDLKKAGSSFPDSEDGVSFILGQVRVSENATGLKNCSSVEDEDPSTESKEIKVLIPEEKPQFLNVTEKENISADENMDSSEIEPRIPKQLGDMGALNANTPCEPVEGESVKSGAVRHVSESAQTGPDERMGDSYRVQCDTEVKKRIIVIGAGPAGLTAARHLQRQGFSVIVLEARDRIGGRVYTDRSSLSVPVDLGASIITGIEADMATERRPDPSSIICAQLGLELTVLNSDCPLYDIVTGQKVPSDLDDTLEAEYNSLLDDMVLLVAQKGEQAMKMSLEDGLEYALRRRRMGRSNSKNEDFDCIQSGGTFVDSRKDTVYGSGPEKNCPEEDTLSPLERRVMNWHFAHLEYGCAALLKEVSLPYWNQDDAYGGFGGAHCMIKGGYSAVVESLSQGLSIHLNSAVTDISYGIKNSLVDGSYHKRVKILTSNGQEFVGDAALITVPLGCLKAGTVKFTPPLPPWKQTSIQRLGFGVLNKLVLEFSEVFWDDSVDYFGATAEETNQRGRCFMFWNVKKTVGAPVLIALLVGKAAIDGQGLSSSDHVNHALIVLRKLFGEASVPDPVASVVTDWGGDPFSYGAYSYVAIGASGEDYDILGRPVENCLFFAGEATCKEHPDTVGGAMISGLREAVRMIDILCTGEDYTAEREAMEAAERHNDSERDEVRDITTRLEAVKISNSLYENSLEGTKIISWAALLREMFFSAKTAAGRSVVAKQLLKLPVKTLKSFAGTKKGLATLNSWILDSLGKDGTQLLRQCVRILVLVSTDLLAVRLSGIGKTVKDKVCVHTSRDIRGIASQLVNVWLEIFRKEKYNGSKLSKKVTATDAFRRKSLKDSTLGKPPVGSNRGLLENKVGLQVAASSGNLLASSVNNRKKNDQPIKLENVVESKSEINSSISGGTLGRLDNAVENDNDVVTEEERAALAAAEKARAAALAAAEAYASYQAKCNTVPQLPKIPSFHKFVRREHYSQTGGSDVRGKFSDGVLGRQDYMSEIDSRNCRVRDWSIDFSAACVNIDSSRMSADNLSRRSHSNEVACHLGFTEHSGESAAVDSSIFTKAWVDTDGCEGIKDSLAIERWQSQAATAGAGLLPPHMHIKDEEDSNTNFKQPTWRYRSQANESSVSQDSINMESSKALPRGAAHIKQAVIDFAASLLMPLYKEKKIDRDGYKSIMKKTATKVMEKATDAEKAMTVNEFLDSKRRNKIRDFVDKLIEKHMASKPATKP